MFIYGHTSEYFTKQALLIIYCVFARLDNEIVSGFSKTQQYFFYFYLKMLRSIDHHQAIFTSSLCGDCGTSPNVLQPTWVDCTNPALVSPFHLQRRSM
jgi:hypothetical protein